MKNHWKISKERERDSHQHAYNATIVDSTPFNKEQIDQIIKLLETNSSSGNSSVSLAQLGNCSRALSTSSSWTIDSEASDHMTNLSCLTNHTFLYIAMKKFALLIVVSPLL